MNRSTWTALGLLVVLVLAAASAALWRPREVTAVAGSLAQGMWIRTYNAPSGSMRPTLEVGDYLFAVTSAFENRIPARGEVAVYWSSIVGANSVSRIVGLPGDRIQMRGGIPRINGRPVKGEQIGDYVMPDSGETLARDLETLPDGIAHPILEMDDNSYLDNAEEIVVPPDAVFFMSDNRDNAADGRVYGPIPLENLKDKPLFIYWSGDWSRVGMAIR